MPFKIEELMETTLYFLGLQLYLSCCFSTQQPQIVYNRAFLHIHWSEE